MVAADAGQAIHPNRGAAPRNRAERLRRRARHIRGGFPIVNDSINGGYPGLTRHRNISRARINRLERLDPHGAARDARGRTHAEAPMPRNKVIAGPLGHLARRRCRNSPKADPRPRVHRRTCGAVGAFGVMPAPACGMDGRSAIDASRFRNTRLGPGAGSPHIFRACVRVCRAGVRPRPVRGQDGGTRMHGFEEFERTVRAFDPLGLAKGLDNKVPLRRERTLPCGITHSSKTPPQYSGQSRATQRVTDRSCRCSLNSHSA